MMRYLLLCTVLCCGLVSSAQYKNDNVAFKTVYIEDLCAQIKANPNAVLLDVRSKGEYEDTSTFQSLNIGRLKNTIHLDVNEMPTRWRELMPYKDQPIYVMCSHSQRSRRVSKMLSDSGFSNIINVNGGLTTYNLLASSAAICKDMLYETGNRFKFVSPLDICNFMATNKNAFILDVRSDSAFRGIAVDERQNVLGTIRGSVNIPLATLRTSTDAVPKDRKILIVDNFGNDASQAARLLYDKGYTDVHVLFNGMDMVMSRNQNEVGCMAQLTNRKTKYHPLSGEEFDALFKKEKNLAIVDVRPIEEFNNQSKQAFRNIGHIRNAINIPSAEIGTRYTELGSDKNRPVVIYHFGSTTDAYMAARTLTNQGFSKVYVLSGGLFNLRWQAANYKGRSRLKDHVVNIPAENQ